MPSEPETGEKKTGEKNGAGPKRGKNKGGRGGTLKRKYRIPSEDLLRAAIKNVLSQNPVVSSQEKMKWLVLRELASTDPSFRVSGERIRRVAARTPGVVVETSCRETSEKRNLLVCPVCSSRTDVVKNMTIYGGVVSLAHVCPVCGYWSGIFYRAPVRYRFVLEEKKR